MRTLLYLNTGTTLGWVLGGFPRPLRCWEAAGIVAKLHLLDLTTIAQLDPVRARNISLYSHPEVDAHSGDEGTSQESPILEAHEQARLPHTGIPHQHDLEQAGGAEDSGLELRALPT